MPEITRFNGIIIKMFFRPREHDPPHIHALCGEYAGVFLIQTAEMMEGDLPPSAQQLVIQWICLYRESLMVMWTSQNLHKLPPL